MFILDFKLSNSSKKKYNNTQWSTILHSRALELPDSLMENYQSIYQYSFYAQYLNIINKQIVQSHNKCQTRKQILNKKHINL